jgi:hypothetical protein
MRRAILQAADHIETRPWSFNFGESRKPEPCGSAGCALGWIGHYAEIERNEDTPYYMDDVVAVMGTTEAEFYSRMDDAQQWLDGKSWSSDNVRCADTLRRYADKYYPEEAA